MSGSATPPPDNSHALPREWIIKAENDLKNAVHALKLGTECPTDTVAFHAQQCVEKHLKSLLLFHGLDAPKVHNLVELVQLLPHGILADWPLSEQRILNSYAVIIRYPGDYAAVPLKEARAAVRIAKDVRREVRRLLPRVIWRKSPSKRRGKLK
jgi:HEPN domain-containing protein